MADNTWQHPPSWSVVALCGSSNILRRSIISLHPSPLLGTINYMTFWLLHWVDCLLLSQFVHLILRMDRCSSLTGIMDQCLSGQHTSGIWYPLTVDSTQGSLPNSPGTRQFVLPLVLVHVEKEAAYSSWVLGVWYVCGSSKLFRIFLTSPSVWGLANWIVVGDMAWKIACWMWEHCPAGTPYCRQGFVEKLFSALTQSSLVGLLIIWLIAVRQLDNLCQCLIRLHLGFQLGAKLLPKQEFLTFEQLLAVLLQPLVDSPENITPPCLRNMLIGITQEHQSALNNIQYIVNIYHWVLILQQVVIQQFRPQAQ